MSERSTAHDTFVIERVYPASPARVFRAFSSLEELNAWRSCHPGARFEMDFREGGRELYCGGSEGGPVYRVETLYHDIVPNCRFVRSYEMHADDVRLSVSLQTVEFKPEGTGTRLVFTEQGVFLDGHDVPAHRAHGTGIALDQLAELLSREAKEA